MDYQIETGVPIPAPPPGRPKKYPFDSMRIGDSFFVPCAVEELERTRVRLASSATHLRKTGREFTTRRYKDAEPIGIRVWRTK